jgi:hypothetical protein
MGERRSWEAMGGTHPFWICRDKSLRATSMFSHSVYLSRLNTWSRLIIFLTNYWAMPLSSTKTTVGESSNYINLLFTSNSEYCLQPGVML